MSHKRYLLIALAAAILLVLIVISAPPASDAATGRRYPSVLEPKLRGVWAEQVIAGTASTGQEQSRSAELLKHLEEKQLIPTSGALDWEFFTIGQDAYLALANSRNDTTYNVDSKIYRWNGTGFTEIQAIPTSHAVDWEFFTVGGDAYLVVANHFNGSTRNIDSKIYRWNGTAFAEFQSILTHGASDWTFFTIGQEAYLAVANNYNGSTCNIDSKIYRWSGTSFGEFQSIPTHCATDWEPFTTKGETYLAVANSNNDFTDRIDSKVYKWNGGHFVEEQSIPTQSALDWESFAIDGAPYLVVANLRAEWGVWNVDSTVYRWDGSRFIEFQSIPTSGACDWESFTVGEDTYLAVANGRWSVTNFSPDSKVYRWNGTGFSEMQSIPTDSAHDWEAFTIGNDLYLAVANYRNTSTWMRDSVIYRAILEPGPVLIYMPVMLLGYP